MAGPLVVTGRTKNIGEADNSKGPAAADDRVYPSSQKLADAGRRRATLACVSVSQGERTQLLRWIRARTSPHRLVVRSRIILLASEGLSGRAIAARLHVAPATVRLWCERFSRHGVGSLQRDAPGRGRRPGMSYAGVRAVLEAMRETPESGAWTPRTLAARAGTSASTVWRVWRRYHVGPASSPHQIANALAKAITEKR